MAPTFLSCRVCLQRINRLAASSTLALETASRSPSRNAAATPLGRQRGRSYATATFAAAAETSVQDAPQALPVHNEQDATVALARQKEREKLQRAVKKHLAHMDDPWKIAQHVEQTLSKDRFDEALLLTQQCSKGGQVVVAWNHLIQYQLEKQQLKGAMKLFNDMKKRGQLPNVQTFTIIFRGCAKSQHPKAAVAEAIKHYNMLMADKRLKPNSIHLNAVLNVCARAGDLDSMFLIADTANDSTRAPTAYTYTTILNALRHDAIKDIKTLPQHQQDANLQKAVDRSKRLWVEVMDRWKQGWLIVDEELVCAMGRVLLLSPRREDKREVLDLLHQTMNIPNLSKQALKADSYPAQGPAQAQAPASSQQQQQQQEQEQAKAPAQDADKHNTALTKTPLHPPSSSSSTVPEALYAIPGRNTLALLLTTLASAKLTTSGIKYWNLLVRQHNIVPDHDNWLRLFGMLKVAKASAHAASTLALLPHNLVSPKPYQIAMQTCIRDNINPHAITNATTVLDSMLARLPTPDIHTLRLYLRVALVSHFHLRTRAQHGPDEAHAAKRDYGAQITAALRHLWEPYKMVFYHYFKATPMPPPENILDRGILYNNKREVIALARLMYSSYNKVMNEKMLPERDLRPLRPVAAKINREIQAFYSNREKMEPQLRRSAAAAADSAEESEPLTATEDTMPERHGGDFVWDTTKSGEPVSLRRRSRSRYDKT